jgi:ABC-type sugar transport system ATPase subunit
MALAGALGTDSGVIRIKGEPVRMRGIADAIKLGIAYLPAERKTDGLFLGFSVGDNIISAALPRFSRMGFLDYAARDRIAMKYALRLNLGSSNPRRPVGQLSGGNQQKVMMAKWLSNRPQILITNEPTKGVDIGAKYEIHSLLRRLAEEGAGILVISSDLPEILSLCDRILVMHEGRITGELDPDSATEEAIISYATGVEAHLDDHNR